MTPTFLPKGRHRCNSCGSSDGLAYLDKGTYCHACETFTPYTPGAVIPKENITKKAMVLFDTSKLSILPITDRLISKETCDFYQVGSQLDDKGQVIAHHYPIMDRGRNPARLGTKIRRLPKDFAFNPSGENIDKRGALFGANLFQPGQSKAITVTEGHLDALAGYQMFGSKWPFTSIIGGASQARDEFRRNLEYLESFDKVYICFDRDDEGQKAAVACAKLLSPGKAHIVALDPELKDACGYLKAGRQQEFVKTWWNAAVYTPAGILSSSALKERIRNRKLEPGIPYPFEGINKLTYGIRKKEAVIVTAPTGVGKTTFLRETMWNILQENKSAKIGTMFLEEDPNDTGLGLMSMKASIPFHLPDAQYTQEQYDAAEKVLDEDRVYFFDHFGSNKIDEILSRVRYYAKGLGCDYIFIDHLSIIVSDQQQGDERKALDEIMTRLKTLTMELDIALIAVVHTNRQGQIRGTAGIEQLANIVIQLDRDLTNEDEAKRRTLMGVVSKNRFSGKTGPAFAVMYNEDTGRLDEPDEGGTAVPLSEEELTKFFDDGIMASEGDADGA